MTIDLLVLPDPFLVVLGVTLSSDGEVPNESGLAGKIPLALLVVSATWTSVFVAGNVVMSCKLAKDVVDAAGLVGVGPGAADVVTMVSEEGSVGAAAECCSCKAIGGSIQ